MPAVPSMPWWAWVVLGLAGSFVLIVYGLVYILGKADWE